PSRRATSADRPNDQWGLPVGPTGAAGPPTFFSLFSAVAVLSTGSLPAFCGPLLGPVPGGLPFAAGAGALGSGCGESLWLLRNASTSARSCGSLSPAKVILVPGANVRGLVSHLLRLSQFHVPPTFFSASEKAKPLRSSAMPAPRMPHRFGPSWLAPPLSALWQAMHLLKICW